MRKAEWRVERVSSVGSTNDLVAARARAGEPEGLVVVADFQEAGRGRRDRTWVAPPGSALLSSYLLSPPLSVEERHWALVAVALSARAALNSYGAVDLKWPNDLLVGEKKLGGLLAQVVEESVVVGLGLNVRRPDSGLVGATSVEESWGVVVSRDELLENVLDELGPRRELLNSVAGRDAVREEYRGALATLGRRVRCQLDVGVVTGLARDVDERGCLLVEGDEGMRTVAAADVVHLRGEES
ncbi:MAG: biotin--[acetyl-CoA-carboxylase] ligase [Acidimicrobiaceae bacterium]|nr:biotin--[acetyl-CoA-carboxylase] ligase [Acidimicrobiaceae bacterium]